MFILNGKPLREGTAFEHEGILYPANWLNLSSAEEKEAIGITEVPEESRPDDRFYWVTDNSDGTYTATPKDLEVVKSNLISQAKATAGTLLQATDWKIIREAEGGTQCSPEVKAERAAIRLASNDYEAAINACTTVEEVIPLVPLWPVKEEANLAPAETPVEVVN